MTFEVPADGTVEPTPGSPGDGVPVSPPTAELLEAERRYRSLTENLPIVIYLDGAGPEDTMIDVSQSIETMLGVSREEWLESFYLWIDLLHPDDRDRVFAESERSVETGESFCAEYRMIARDGREVWIHDESVLATDENGEPLHWLGIMLDITELKSAQAQLGDAEKKYRALVEQIPAIVYLDVVDEAMSTSYVSPQIEELLGITPEEYIENADLWYDRLHPEDKERALAQYLEGRDSGESFTFEYRLIARDGRVVWFRDSASVLRDESGSPTHVQGVMLDVTERKQAEEQAAFLAYHDPLTGLPNRRMFEELLELSIARARRHDAAVAVVYTDLDDFKTVNDSLGHERGDELLKIIAERLREATRETDLVARQGGDEFLLLLADLERTSGSVLDAPDGALLVAESVANRIQQALETPFELAGTEVYVSASIGIAMFPHDADDAATLLKNADSAMYRSKKAGPGGYQIHTGNDADAMSRLSLSTRLRKAVENQNWMLHYQPLVDLTDQRIVGVEALIRWPDPNGGLVPPGDFIPLAEEMGLIEAIGDWVVEELSRQERTWRELGLELEVSFNLSPRQLWQPDLADKITRQLSQTGVSPRNVVVEITESTAMIDPDRTQRILWDLHARGLRLAIDDFGTGYSSLSRLKHLPVDVLKIDRAFVREVDADRNAGSMVSAIIALASSLGMVPLAEGIETEAEWRFLQTHGCPMGQGFYFSKPVPADDITAMLRRAGLRVVPEAG